MSGGQAPRVRGAQVERIVRAGLEVAAAGQAGAASPGRKSEQRIRRANSVWMRVNQVASDAEGRQAWARLATEFGIFFSRTPGGGGAR